RENCRTFLQDAGRKKRRPTDALQFVNRQSVAAGDSYSGGRVGRERFSCHESGDRRFAGDTPAFTTYGSIGAVPIGDGVGLWSGAEFSDGRSEYNISSDKVGGADGFSG